MVVAAAFVDMASDDAPRVMAAEAAKLGRTENAAAELRMVDRAIKCDFIDVYWVKLCKL